MEMEDMILVSVDDHVIEPPDLFKNHLPAVYQDRAPKMATIRYRASVVQPDPQGHISHRAAGGGHERQRRAGRDLFFDLSVVCGQRLPGFEGQAAGTRGDQYIQRLTYRRVVRRRAGPLHSAVDPAAVGYRPGGGRSETR